MIIVNTAIKFLNPLFPNYKNLHKYWWHWIAVLAGIISSSLAVIWILGYLIVYFAFPGSDTMRFLRDALIGLGPAFVIGMIMPAILYRVFLRMLGISNESPLRKVS